MTIPDKAYQDNNGYDNALKYTALTVVALASFLGSFMISALNVALPSIQREFHTNAVLLSWIALASLLTLAMFLVPMSRIGDIYGRKKVFFSGTSLFGIASFMGLFAPTSSWLIAARAIQGIGTAMYIGTSTAILTSVFPPHERGKVLGVSVAATYLGLSLGPFLGGFFTDHFGWRSLFILNCIISVGIFAAVFFKLKAEWAESAGEKFDTVGACIYSVSILFIMCGFSSLPRIWGFILIFSGSISCWFFIRWSGGQRTPIIDFSLLKTNRVFSLSNLAALIHYSATFAVTFLLSLYLQYIRGMDAFQTGIILVAQPVVQAVFSPLTGWLSDRIEPRIVASSGIVLMVVNLGLFAFLTNQTNIVLIVTNLVILGFGYALFSSPNINAIMSSVEPKVYGVASGTLSTSRVIGQVMSMGLSTLVFALYLGNDPIKPDNYTAFLKSVKVLFGLFAVLATGGVVASLARGNVRKSI